MTVVRRELNVQPSVVVDGFNNDVSVVSRRCRRALHQCVAKAPVFLGIHLPLEKSVFLVD